MQTQFISQHMKRVKSDWLLLIQRAVNGGILLWALLGIITGVRSSWVVWTAFKLLALTFIVSVLVLIVSMWIEKRRNQ